MSIVRVLSGQIGDGVTLLSPEREAGRVVRHLQAAGPDHREARPGDGRRDGGARQARTRQDRRHAVGRQAGACRRWPRSSRIRRCWRSRSPRRSARTTSSSARRCTSWSRRIPRSSSCTTPRPTRWCCGARARCICASRPSGLPTTSASPSAPGGRRSATTRPSRKAIQQRGRHKKQSGGHGQFGDVVLDIKPLPRGSGFKFEDKITGGVVPRNYIPSVEEGVIDALKHGPLGFPVVDVAVALIDGSYHTVDSSDMAFQTAARIGIVEGLPQCQPVLLEPIHLVEIVCPTEATAKINAILSGRRGQILGFDTREGWDGWDVVRAQDAGVRDRRPDHRGALGDRRRRQLHLQVRPHGRTDRQDRRPDRRGETRGGVSVVRPPGAPCGRCGGERTTLDSAAHCRSNRSRIRDLPVIRPGRTASAAISGGIRPMNVIRRRGWEMPESRATPEHLFFNRRAFLGAAAGAAATGARRPSIALAQRVTDHARSDHRSLSGQAQREVHARPAGHRREDQHQLQQFLRIQLDQERRQGRRRR